MNKHRNKYWHIQMYKPYGKEDETRVDSKKMLEREKPFIGTGEWDNYQCEDFKTIEKGSIVLVREGNEAIALCQIISDNFTDRELTDEFLHKNFRRVKILAWAKDYKQPSNSRLFTQGTFSSCGHRTEQYEYINHWLKHIENMEFTNKCARLLERKRNIIIQGAPGTGKTYNTASIALKILGVTDIDLTDHEAVIRRYKELTTGKRIFFTTFHQSLDYEDFVEGLKPEVQKNEKGESVGVTYKPEGGIFKQACQAVTMDESKDITEYIDDFLHHKINGFENRRVIPTITGKSSFYAWWEEGRTTIKCKSIHSTSTRKETHSPSPLNIKKVKLQAQGKGKENNWSAYAKAFIEAVKEEYNIHGNNKVVLIIDEINRGNIAKIFGELITLLEVDKREGSEHPIQVTLPYSKELFSVPKNLYIIGTMNTTDRSTGTIDYALRRRFAFVTLESNSSVIEKHYTDPTLKDQALALFNNIEEFIRKKLCGDLDIDDLMVGHSYFMSASEEEQKEKMEYEVLPLIAEYINDGILNVSSEEKKAAFEAWRKLQLATIEEVNEEEEQEEE